MNLAHDLVDWLTRARFDFSALFLVLAACFFALPFLVCFVRKKRFNESLIEDFGLWLVFALLGVAMLRFSSAYGVVTEAYVVAGDANATVLFGGKEYRFQAGEAGWLSAKGWRDDLSRQRTAFVSTSQNGRVIRRELGPNVYLAELSGKKTVYWSEVLYDGPYDQRADYRPRGSVRGDAAFLTTRASDVIVRPGEAPPPSLDAPGGVMRQRVLEISDAERPETARPESGRRKRLEETMSRRPTQDELKALQEEVTKEMREKKDWERWMNGK
mgnify:CR=1 FL=1